MHLKIHGMEMLFKFLFQQIVVFLGILSVRFQVVQLQHMEQLAVQETLIHLHMVHHKTQTIIHQTTRHRYSTGELIQLT